MNSAPNAASRNATIPYPEAMTPVRSPFENAYSLAHTNTVIDALLMSSIVPEKLRDRGSLLMLMEIHYESRIKMLDILPNFVALGEGRWMWRGAFLIHLIQTRGNLGGKLRFQDRFLTGVLVETTAVMDLPNGQMISGRPALMAEVTEAQRAENAAWRENPEQTLRYRAASRFAQAHCPVVFYGSQPVEFGPMVDYSSCLIDAPVARETGSLVVSNGAPPTAPFTAPAPPEVSPVQAADPSPAAPSPAAPSITDDVFAELFAAAVSPVEGSVPPEAASVAPSINALTAIPDQAAPAPMAAPSLADAPEVKPTKKRHYNRSVIYVHPTFTRKLREAGHSEEQIRMALEAERERIRKSREMDMEAANDGHAESPAPVEAPPSVGLDSTPISMAVVLGDESEPLSMTPVEPVAMPGPAASMVPVRHDGPNLSMDAASDALNIGFDVGPKMPPRSNFSLDL